MCRLAFLRLSLSIIKNIKTKTVVEVLTQFFTRCGIAKKVQSDQGSNFMSNIFKQALKALGVSHVTSTAYHPESQGALERFHQTLKSMMKSYCAENPEDWDKGIGLVLFAIREVPNESTGFSPFELVYGHEVRGPLKLVKEKLLQDHEDTNLCDYVTNFHERLTRACEVAGEHLKATQARMKVNFDRKSVNREFKPGDEVLMLIPIEGDSLSAKFSGPYKVEKKIGEVNYVISTPDRRNKHRICHINMLKLYKRREVEVPAAPIVTETSVDSEPQHYFPKEPADTKLENSSILENIDSEFAYFDEQKRPALISLIQEFPEIFQDRPGKTTLATHDVDVGDAKPIKQHPYRTSPAKTEIIRQEVKYMLENGLIEESTSNWSSPIVLAPKEGNLWRACIDLRKVNSVTKADSFPIPRIEDCIDRVGHAKFVTKIDLLKGYWQVPLTDRAKEISAFCTPDGLFQPVVMPFGLKNAPASFQRLMNQITADVDGCVAYIDDVIVFSDTLEDHMISLRHLFQKLSDANLVVNLKKSEFGKAKVTYLGHVVGQGQVAPRQAKVEAIVNFAEPKTKRELLRFLGMSGFYRRFCENYSTVAMPLTNLLKNRVKFEWTKDCQEAFDKLKGILASSPVLMAPDFSKPFKMAVDASDIGIGAVLLQEDSNGLERPICYYSKKLNKTRRITPRLRKNYLVWCLRYSTSRYTPVMDLSRYTRTTTLWYLWKNSKIRARDSSGGVCYCSHIA